MARLRDIKKLSLNHSITPPAHTETLTILLGKASVMLKPFLPQLQTTFLKALNDTNRNVRLKAGAALAHLITIHTRPDPLYNELHTGIKNADEAAVRDTYIQVGVCGGGGVYGIECEG